MGDCWRLRPVNMLQVLLVHCIMIHLYIAGTTPQTVVRGVVGQDMRLPCTYSVRTKDHLTDMCWGRGSCPKSKCSNEILRTDGTRVTSRKSYRYQLKGPATRGDVSLTIVNLNEGDKGVYCCRIELPGWFNDLKRTLNLQVDRATTTASTTTTTSYRITTTTTTLLTTTVTLPTTPPFLAATNPTSPISTVVPPITNVPPLTSSVSTAITFPTTVSSLVNIKSSLTSLQDWTENRCPLVTETAHPITATATTSHRITTISTTALLTTTVSPPPTPPFPFTTNSLLQSSLPLDAKTTNVPAVSTMAMSTATGFSTPAPSSVNTKSPTSLQDKWTMETTPPATGRTNGQKPNARTGDDQPPLTEVFESLKVPGAIVLSIFLLMLLALLVIVKYKSMRKYHLDNMNSLKTQEESEQMFTGNERENGLFSL